MTVETYTPQADVDLTPPKRWPLWACALSILAGTAASWALLIGFGLFLGFMARLFLAYFGGA